MQRLISKFPNLYIFFKDKYSLKNALVNIKGYRAIKKNNLLDLGFYLKNYPNVNLSGMDPILHYMYYGFKEGKKPNSDFDGNYYLNKYKDVRKSNLNPLVHYSLYGMNEGRKIKKATTNDRREKPEIRLTKSEIKKKYDEILYKSSLQVNLHYFDETSPLISIIMANRNGLKHLKRLFKNFKENIQYSNYEVIVVDNGSTDDSIKFLEELSKALPIKIIKNGENRTFSEANNQAARVANGEYLLLLNNDVQPLYGWLNQMMQTALKYDNAGAVGAKLIYPDCSNSKHNKHNSFKIQHMGIAFKKEKDFIKPYNIVKTDPFDVKSNLESEKAAVTAAALLVQKDRFWQVGGLDEGYNYGYEDVDLCLKLHKNGYGNVYCAKAVLFHYEFGTQDDDKNKDIKIRRLNNRTLFSQKWNKWLYKELIKDKLGSNGLFSEKPLKVAFAVTECGENASAGDYFTAFELGESLKKFGWEITFLSRRGPENWYNIGEDVDVLISMIDIYDPRKINCSNKSLIKVAWLRNWFDRWISRPGFSCYNIVLASSQTACNYLKERNIASLLLPIATNASRFHNDFKIKHDYSCDYCFTGSYWNSPREIIEMLDPEDMHYKFKLYGQNWNEIDKFKKYHQGFIAYSDLPEVYASTKIVIDDANMVTKKYGAVNSRVYDALASGALVLTNGVIGAQETFKGKLPVFKSKKELNSLIEYYLSHEDERKTKIKELQKFVLENHTYDNRSQILKEVLEEYFLNIKNNLSENKLKKYLKVSIKIAAPNMKGAPNWGDYDFALALKKEFEKNNYETVIHTVSQWDENDDVDIVLVLRGLNRYKPKAGQFNIMWNISHPDLVSVEEYNEFDYVFVASDIWADELKTKVKVPVESLIQCTDSELFYPEPSEEYKHDILFVGNSRHVFRRIVKDLLPTDKNFGLYGGLWDQFIDKKYIKGRHIKNTELHKAYSSCKILLNDHWEDMAEKGFISNRLFDGFAAGAFIISDEVKGAEDIFGDALVTYSGADELHELIDYYLDNDLERVKKVEKGRKIVLANHTFEKRAERILEVINDELSKDMVRKKEIFINDMGNKRSKLKT